MDPVLFCVTQWYQSLWATQMAKIFNHQFCFQIRTLIQKKAELTIKISDQDLKRKHVKKAISSAIDGINHNKVGVIFFLSGR